MTTHLSLVHYYGTRYPCDEIHALLRMRDGAAERREVSAQFQGNGNVYAQKHFARVTADQLRQTLMQRAPESLHMGQMVAEEPLYSALDERKELVFDIDCTDFRRFCACDGHKQLCQLCWGVHIVGAILVLRHFLCRQLGVAENQLLWVFSGGKGIHCFVNARAYLCLGDPERSRLFRLLQCANDDWPRMSQLTQQLATQHPDFMEQLEQHFVCAVLQRLDALCNEKLRAFCMQALAAQFPLIHFNLQKAWAQYDAGARIQRAKPGEAEPTESEQRWCLLQRVELNVSGFDSQQVRPSQCLMLRLLWPMVDAGPLSLAHRIKLPFSVHATAPAHNIALPMTAEQLMQMNPLRDALTFQEVQLSRVTPKPFVHGVALLREWLTHYNE